MEMKRLFAYLIAALMLSLLLCGCGGTMDDGNVAASPWPDMTHQVTPAPTAALSPLPDLNMENNAGEPGGEAENGMSTAAPDLSTSMPRTTGAPASLTSPDPTDVNR
jgi:hypothetical protein